MNREERIDRAYEYASRIRRMALGMGRYAGKAGCHIGGSFSCIEILSVLYGAVMHTDPADPAAADCDRFIPSKAHCTLSYFPALVCAGFLREEDVSTFFDDGGLLAGKPLLPAYGVEYSGGSLGLGLSVGLGKALHARRAKLPFRTYVLLGDGECNEGSVWEAVMAAGRFRLDNLIAVVDCNKLQNDGANEDIMGLGDLKAKFEAFEWTAAEADGHCIEELLDAFAAPHEGRPLAVIAHTVKANGIPSLEGQAKSHYAVLSEEDCEEVLRQMEAGRYDRVR